MDMAVIADIYEYTYESTILFSMPLSNTYCYFNF